MSKDQHPGSRARRLSARGARVAGLLTAGVAGLLGLAVLMTIALVASGYRPTTDHSNSMVPDIHRGDVLFSRAILASQARVGDVITFDDPYFKGVRLTHRVRAEHPLAGGRISFTTRGDANPGSEHWTIAAGGHLTKLSFVVPKVGLMFMSIGAHPLYLAIAIVLALWLAILQMIWRRGGRDSLRDEALGSSRARHRLSLTAVGGGLLLVMALSATAAVGYIKAQGYIATPSVTLAVNDEGRPLFVLPTMKPGEESTACELVTNQGPGPANVGIYDGASGSGLQNYLDLAVVRGVLPPETDPGSCKGFKPDPTAYIKRGPGVIYEGVMGSFATSPAAPLADPQPQWPSGSSVAYRMTVSLADENGAQGLTAVQRFYFGNIVANEEVKTAPTETTPPPPTKTTTTTTTVTQPPPPLIAPRLSGVKSSTGADGSVTITMQLSGGGQIGAVASLSRTTRLPARRKAHGKATLRRRPRTRTTLTLLGAGSVRGGQAGRFQIVIKPITSALKIYRKHPKLYRIQVVLTVNNGPAKPYVLRLWLSLKELGILARTPGAKKKAKPPRHPEVTSMYTAHKERSQ